MSMGKLILVILLLSLIFSMGLAPKYKDAFILNKPSSGDIKTKNLPLTMELNFWNIATYEGETWMAFYEKDDAIEYYADIKNIVLRSPSSWVHGYPEVYYGYKPWSSHGISLPKLPLPVKVSEFPEANFVMKHSLWYEKNLPINFAMETWITKTEKPNTVTNGDIEMMVWLYANNLGPAGKIVDTAKIPIILNGKEKELIWDIYFSPGGWDYIAFKSRENIKEGEVKIPIKLFLVKLKDVISKYSSKVTDYDNMYVLDWEIGTEFGSPYIKDAKFGWIFSNFDIEVK